MPLYNRRPYRPNIPAPGFLRGPDVQDFQRKYNDPGTRSNLDLLATQRDPAVAPSPTLAAPTPATPPALASNKNWWSSLGAGGQSALLRSALAAGSAMLQRTDPEARNPLTAASAGVLRGLDVHDAIREEQRKTGLRSSLADISTDQPSAAYAGEVGRTLAGAGEVPDALSAFQAESRLTPEPTKPILLKTRDPGDLVYNPITGGTVVSAETEPKSTRIYPSLRGGFVRYDEDTDTMVTVSEGEAKETKVGPEQRVLRQTKGGGYETVVKATPREPKVPTPPDKQVREQKLLVGATKQATREADEKFGKRPPRYKEVEKLTEKGFVTETVENLDYLFDERLDFINKRVEELRVKAGIPREEVSAPTPQPAIPHDVPLSFKPRSQPASPTARPKVSEGAPELDDAYIENMVEYNRERGITVSAEEVVQDYHDRYGIK